MTNIQLQIEFDRISNIKDCFDFYLELKKLNKEYKTTPFYKNTRMRIKDAYGLFMKHTASNILVFLNRLTSTEYVVNLLNEYLNGIDEDTLNALLNRITTALDPAQLQKYQDQLTNTIDKIKVL